MFKLQKYAYKIFAAALALFVGVFLWAGITGTRLIGDGKETYEPDGKASSGSRVRTSTGAYHRFHHK
jgi:hypothetical protein